MSDGNVPIANHKEKSIWLSMSATALMPALFVSACIVLILMALALIYLLNRQFLPLLLFAVGALALFHLVAWVCARLSDERTYKIVEYIYLGLGLLGVLGVISAQSEVARDHISRAVKVFSYKEVNACRVLDSERCRIFQDQLRWLRDEFTGQHTLPPKFLWDLTLKDGKGYPDEQEIKRDMHEFDDTLRYLWNESALVRENTSEQRFFPLYLLAVAIALRITKVSAELFKWYRTKETLPTS
jgi:hypothetical protein